MVECLELSFILRRSSSLSTASVEDTAPSATAIMEKFLPCLRRYSMAEATFSMS